MHRSNGEIGTFFQCGKQIGGFLDWSIELKLNSRNTPDGRVYKPAIVKATANRYWLNSRLNGAELEALYYQMVKERLVLVNKAKVKVKLGVTLDKIINQPIEMIWIT